MIILMNALLKFGLFIRGMEMPKLNKSSEKYNLSISHLFVGRVTV